MKKQQGNIVTTSGSANYLADQHYGAQPERQSTVNGRGVTLRAPESDDDL